MHGQDTTEAQTLERAIHESIRAIHLQLDDLRAATERLRQLRQQEADQADHRLIVEHGCCGRAEVVR